jgi:hypothetical protein
MRATKNEKKTSRGPGQGDSDELNFDSDYQIVQQESYSATQIHDKKLHKLHLRVFMLFGNI